MCADHTVRVLLGKGNEIIRVYVVCVPGGNIITLGGDYSVNESYRLTKLRPAVIPAGNAVLAKNLRISNITLAFGSAPASAGRNELGYFFLKAPIVVNLEKQRYHLLKFLGRVPSVSVYITVFIIGIRIILARSIKPSVLVEGVENSVQAIIQILALLKSLKIPLSVLEVNLARLIPIYVIGNDTLSSAKNVISVPFSKNQGANDLGVQSLSYGIKCTHVVGVVKSWQA